MRAETGCNLSTPTECCPQQARAAVNKPGHRKSTTASGAGLFRNALHHNALGSSLSREFSPHPAAGYTPQMPSAPPWRTLLELARWAPSAHNTQPWHATHDGKTLVVRADPTRTLARTDPTRRDLRLSLGGFVEAIRLAALAEGLALTITPGPDPDSTRLAVDGAAAANQQGASLLRQRQTSRLPYLLTPLTEPDLQPLHTVAQAHDLQLHLAPRGGSDHTNLSRWHTEAARAAWLDPAGVNELRHWFRIDPEGVRQPEDGLSSHCLNLSYPELAALTLLMSRRLRRLAHSARVAPWMAGALARGEAARFDQAPCIVVISSTQPHLQAGAALLHLWLAAADARLAVHPVSVLLDHRGWEVSRHLGVPTAHLLAAWRIGRSAPAPRAGRRAVQDFAFLPP